MCSDKAVMLPDSSVASQSASVRCLHNDWTTSDRPNVESSMHRIVTNWHPGNFRRRPPTANSVERQGSAAGPSFGGRW
jgi:hypothetical protein